MATYSVNNITIDNELHFSIGATAGYVLAIQENGVTYWTPPGSSDLNVDGGTADSIYGGSPTLDGGRA